MMKLRGLLHLAIVATTILLTGATVFAQSNGSVGPQFIINPQSALATLNTAAASTTTCTATSCLSLPRQPQTAAYTCWVEVSGTFSATLIVEGSVSMAAWTTAGTVTPYGSTSTQATIVAPGLYTVGCAPVTRVRMSAFVSGSALVYFYANK